MLTRHAKPGARASAARSKAMRSGEATRSPAGGARFWPRVYCVLHSVMVPHQRATRTPAQTPPRPPVSDVRSGRGRPLPLLAPSRGSRTCPSRPRPLTTHTNPSRAGSFTTGLVSKRPILRASSMTLPKLGALFPALHPRPVGGPGRTHDELQGGAEGKRAGRGGGQRFNRFRHTSSGLRMNIVLHLAA